MKPVQHGTRSSHGTLMGKELYRTEDDQGFIIVTQRGNKRLLSFGSSLEQSSVLMNMPHYLTHEYAQIMLLGLIFVDARDVTLLGLGGGGLVHCLSHYFPQATLQVVEIRQAVIDIAYQWFDLPQTDSLQIVNDDALHYLLQCKQDSSDIIFSDLYQADGMSACQAQQDFIVASYMALSASGCLVLNFHQKPHRGSLLMDTIESFFDTIIVYDSAVSEAGQCNSIMFCCKAEVALHQPAINRRAESLTKMLKMPLMMYYRKLRFNGLDLS
ncbi:MAG: fused MFS/spermidine synthase [Gammaproteobacteria bacterium]|nr:fused MFS/spermidine synthase [Gammaproteobacteria bacterium]